MNSSRKNTYFLCSSNVCIGIGLDNLIALGKQTIDSVDILTI